MESIVPAPNPTVASIKPTARRALSQQHYTLFQPLVRRIALRLARRLPREVSVDDLIGYGWLGLAEAYERAPEGMPTEELEAYVSGRARGAMLDFLRRLDPATRNGRSDVRQLERARRALAGRLLRTPTDAEVAEELDVDEATFKQMAHRAQLAVNARAMRLDASELELASSAEPVDELLDRHVKLEVIKKSMAALPERLQTVLALYYQEHCTLREIGAILGVTESRVCQLHSEAMGRLRTMLAFC